MSDHTLNHNLYQFSPVFICGDKTFYIEEGFDGKPRYKDTNGAIWLVYADCYFAFGLDLNTQGKDGLDYYLDLPDTERLDCDGFCLISEHAVFLLAMQSPVRAFQSWLVLAMREGVMTITKQPIHQSLFHQYVAEHSQPTRENNTRGLNFGYVYLVRSVSGYYKIGRTKNPNSRVRTFGVELPFEIELEHVIPCADYIAAEKQLHQRYADKRLNGEWFALTDGEVVEIKSIESM